MSSLLNNASLLLNPAGSIISYQEDKIYSVLPKDGTGDFTFSGGDGGTRVNQQGYIEVTPANLTTNSENLSSGWTFDASSIVSTNNTAPTNTSNAALITEGTSTAVHRYYTPLLTGVSSGGTYTVSQYVKYHSCQYISLGLGDSSNFRGYMVFDVQNGIIIDSAGQNSGTLNDAGFQNIGGGWYRIWVTVTAPSWASNLISNVIGFQNSSTYSPFGSYTGTDRKIYGWGGQTNNGYIRPYQPTTDRLNYPRITYQNGRGALLSEPQRTNLVLYSQQFNVGWTLYQGATLTPSASLSPDGTQNAFALNVATLGYSGIYQSTGGGTIVATTSIFAKKGTLDWILMVDSAGSAGRAWFNLANGTIGTVTGGWVAKIEPLKDGWYRCILQNPSANIFGLQVGASTGDNVVTPATTGNIYIWGAQLEAGTYPTSYIPTTTATVTRPADSTNNTNTTNVASVVGQTEGVFYSDLYFEANGAERNYMYLNTNGSYNNGFLYLVGTATNKLAVDIYNNPNIQQFSSQSPTLTAGRYKAAIAYKQNDFAFYLNGIQIATDNNGTVPTLNRMYIGQGSDLGWTNGAPVFTTGFFPTRLTNAQLQELTTVRSGSGGNISYYGPYTIHTFIGSGTFTPSFTGPVEVLVVAGGGSGAELFGGGGAGGLIYASSIGVAQGTGYTITIGAGGASQSTYQNNGNNGSNSSAFGLVTIGGGGGGAQSVGLNGGSGGGGGDWAGVGYGGGVGTTGQGNNGGQGEPTGYDGSGGGGGGAGQAGQTGAVLQAGKGGDGLPYSISGFSTYYAGGGGGTCWQGSGTGVGTNGLGGLGGGGLGGNGTTNINSIGGPAVDYTGGGGGAAVRNGGTAYASGKGGNGIVIVRYLT